MIYTATIPLPPITKKNHQQIIKAGNRRMVIPSKQYRQYENNCMPFLRAIHIDYPVNVKALYFMPAKR